MRLLRLDLGQGQLAVDLHPFVTILRHLEPPERASVLDAVRRLAQGSTAGTRGLVEQDGIMVELDGRGDDRLQSNTSVDVVVGPGADPSITLHPVALQALIDQAQRKAEIDAVMVEEIRADLDPAARFRLAAIEAELAPVDEATEARKATERARVEEILGVVASIDSVIREAPPGVAELRDRWYYYLARVEATQSYLGRLQQAINEAQVQLDLAERALVAAEAAATPVLLTRDEEARLEMLSFPGMDESRKGRWRKQLRPEEEAEKQALLDKVGLESWTAYNMYRMDPTPSQARIDQAATARRVRDDAQAELDKSTVALASDSVYAELNQELDAIRDEARGYLGPVLPSDLGEALGELVIERQNPEYHAAIRRLGQVLDELIGPDRKAAVDSGAIDPVAVVVRADAWIRAARSDQGPDLEVLGRARRQALDDIDRHDRALARIERAEAAALASSLELSRLERLLDAVRAGSEATAESILARLEPMVARIRAEVDGSLPIVVLDPIADLDPDQARSVLHGLSLLAEQVQILVVSDAELCLQWASEAGLDTAMVSRPRPSSAHATSPSTSVER
jgi:hypothetical protein